MDWQTLRRQRLAKATSSHEQAQRKGLLASLSLRASGIWASFSASSLWEKGVIVTGLVVLAVMIPVAYFALFAGGGGAEAGGQPSEPSQVVTGPTATEAAIYVIATAIDKPTATQEPTAAAPTPTTKPTAKPTAPVNRRDCGEIAGTPYQSSAERDWFLANCYEAPVVVGPPSGGAPPTATTAHPSTAVPPPPAPTATPTSSSFPSDAALAYHAVDWIVQNTPGIEVLTATCTVTQVSGSQWVVSCTTRPAGCTGGACLDTDTATVCVTSPTFTVWRC